MTRSRSDGQPSSKLPSLSFLVGGVFVVVVLAVFGSCHKERVCSEGLSKCPLSCADLASDPQNCGACGATCGVGQLCQEGRCRSCPRNVCTYDIVAACFNTGQVVGIYAGEDLVGPRSPVGDHPQALGTLYDVLLVADGTQQRLRQAKLADLSLLPGFDELGSSPNHIWAEDPYVYVVNSGFGQGGNTLQILQRKASPAEGSVLDGGIRRFPDGGLFPDGLQLATVGQLFLGTSTSPQAIVKVGDDLFIPLWLSGQVAQVNVADPRAPVVTRMFDLSNLDLRPFGRATFPRPGGAAWAWGKIYVALSNLDADYSPGGPGMLARIDPARGSVDAIYLGADVCLNAFWVVASEEALYVSCSGKATYTLPSYELLAVEKSGVVVLNQREERISAWNVACGPGAVGCVPPSVQRFAVFNHRLYLGDQVGGRVFVVESDGGNLVERRGYNPMDGGPPIPACPRDPGLPSLVIDMIAVP